MRTYDVLVVGAGPAGLATALAARAAGLEVVVVDAAEGRSRTSRAAVVHARTLEVLALLPEAELVPRLLDEGLVVDRFAVLDRGRRLGSADFSELAGRTAHPSLLMLPQWRTETILEEALVRAGAELRRASAVTAVQDREDHAVVDLEGGEQVAAQVVVGADGLHSRVRTSAGIDFRGGSYEPGFVLADVRLGGVSHGRDDALLAFAPQGLLVLVPLPGGLHRIVATHEDPPPEPDVTLVQQVLDGRGPAGARVEEMAWSSRFRVQHRVADRFTRGRVVLAGDAAHVHSPAGGQGMNLGLRDGVELGTVLGEVLATGDDEAVRRALEQYGRRRRHAARRVVAMTDAMTRGATLRHPVPRAARDVVLRTVLALPATRRRLAARLAGLDDRAPAPAQRTAS